MPDITYNMTFNEVLNEIFNTKGWYQGESFGNEVFISVGPDKCVTVFIFTDNFIGKKNLGAFVLSEKAYNMKYRRIYSQPSVERKN